MISMSKYFSSCKDKKFYIGIFLFVLCTINFSIEINAQQAYQLTPISGADGLFESAVVEGDTLYRALDDNGS